jgi:hypothetical protein
MERRKIVPILFIIMKIDVEHEIRVKKLTLSQKFSLLFLLTNSQPSYTTENTKAF